MTMLMASAEGVYLVFLLATAPAYVDSTGWARDLPKIVVLDVSGEEEGDAEKVFNKKFAAWFVPSMAALYIVCALLFGDEGREIWKVIRNPSSSLEFSRVREWVRGMRNRCAGLPIQYVLSFTAFKLPVAHYQLSQSCETFLRFLQRVFVTFSQKPRVCTAQVWLGRYTG